MGMIQSIKEWDSSWKEVKHKFRNAESFWWGDNLDVRFYLYRVLGRIHKKRILELASGPGVLTSAIPGDNEVVCIDLDPKAGECWKKLNPMGERRVLIKGDMFDSSVRKGLSGFDIVLIPHGLPRNDYASERTLGEVLSISKKALKEGGSIIITTPNKLNPYQAKKKKEYGFFDLKEQLEENGFEVQELRSWNPSIFLSRILRFSPLSGIGLALIDRHCLGSKGVSLYVVAKAKSK